MAFSSLNGFHVLAFYITSEHFPFHYQCNYIIIGSGTVIKPNFIIPIDFTTFIRQK